MMREVVLVVVLALTAMGLAACGDDGGAGSAPSGADTTASVSDVGQGDASEDGSGEEAAEGVGPEDSGSGDTDDGGSDVQDVIDDLDFGDGLARVTIGDTSFEFVLGGNESANGTTYIGVCQELFGLLNGGGFVSGDPQIGIEFTIPPPDWESFGDGRYDNSMPRIEIDLGDSGGWAADMSLTERFPGAAGESQIDQWTLEGSVAKGTATFIAMESFSAPVDGSAGVEGSFEIGCEES